MARVSILSTSDIIQVRIPEKSDRSTLLESQCWLEKYGVEYSKHTSMTFKNQNLEPTSIYTFHQRDSNIATLFKLTFGGS